MTIQEQLIKYKEYLLARSLSQNYHNVIRIWLNYLQTKGLDTFTQETITQFFTENNYKDNSKSQFIRAGRSYYNEFLQMKKEDNAWNFIKLIKAETNIPIYIKEEELDLVISKMITHNHRLMTSTKLTALVHFLYHSGCRKSEILKLKRVDFDFTNNSVLIHGKGKKQRITYYTARTSKEIQTYFLSEPEVNSAFNVTLGILNYMPKVFAKYLGRNCFFHLFRHSFARNLIYNKGMDANTVSKLLGHSSMASTLRYISPDEKTIETNYKKLMG
jgi:site-specific recombinase XerD